MITRIIAAVQAARTRPPGQFSVVAGAVLAGAGLALMSRFHGYLQQQLLDASNELEELDQAVIARRNELADLHNRKVEATRDQADDDD